MSPPLRLRPLRPDDEAAFRAAHETMAAEGHEFGLGFDPRQPWHAYLRLKKDHRAGINLPSRWVPTTFLVADAAGEIVGRSAIRHRRRGYATEILRQSLVIARAIGVSRVLVTCDDRNAGSIAVIERCGGRLQDVIDGRQPGARTRRYWSD